MPVVISSTQTVTTNPDSWLDFSEHKTWAAVLTAIASTPGAADVCIHSRGRIRLKIRGHYRIPILDAELASGGKWSELCALLNPAMPSMANNEYARDGGCSIGSIRFRFSHVRELYGEEFTLRPMPSRIPTPAEIQLPAALVKRFVEINDGLIAFAGSTGNGKSTSIASLISENARQKAIRVVTIEDPIEYLHEDMPNGSTFTYRAVGTHTGSFACAMRDAMRMHPDIIVLGELRDAREANVALEAALTGHKVITTLHGGSVEQGMQRLGDFSREIGESAIGGFAQAFRMCVAQRLVHNAAGTALLPLHEILLGTQSVISKIRGGRFFTLRQEMETGSEDGMQTFERSPNYHKTRQ